MSPEETRAALDYALKLLAIRKRTSRQLELRLIEKGFDEEIISRLIRNLEERKLLDDADFAKSFVQEKRNLRPMGKRRLEYELKTKGIPKPVAESALSDISEEAERAAAGDLAAARAAALGNLTREKKRKKIYDYLVRRGFTFDSAREAIERIQ